MSPPSSFNENEISERGEERCEKLAPIKNYCLMVLPHIFKSKNVNAENITSNLFIYFPTFLEFST